MPLLRVENFHKSFGPNQVLRGISLEAGKNEVISVIGPSGSGKSTFLRCLNLLEIPDKGTLELFGSRLEFPAGKIASSQLCGIRTRLSMVFQQFNLWPHLNVLENICLAPMQVKGRSRKEAEEKARHYLQLVGLSEKADAYPHQLSGGQQQRTGIARALAMEPEIMLFDEPTSSLDPELVAEVLSVMRNLAKLGTTMIVVTHELSFARDVSSKIVFLEGGKIADQGAPDALFAGGSDRFRQFISNHRTHH